LVWSWSLLSPPALRGTVGCDHRYAAADEIGYERRQPIILVLRMPILDRHVLALDVAAILEALERTVKFL
jgi:hypothetical protein